MEPRPEALAEAPAVAARGAAGAWEEPPLWAAVAGVTPDATRYRAGWADGRFDFNDPSAPGLTQTPGFVGVLPSLVSPGGSLGTGFYYKDSFNRAPTNLEVMPTYKFAIVNFDLGIKFNFEDLNPAGYDFQLRPGIRLAGFETQRRSEDDSATRRRRTWHWSS
jgi:hypothetical protein